jgi:hypothetical protein
MLILAIVFTLATIVGLAPTFLRSCDRFPSWLDDLPKYQAAFGALTSTTGLASIRAGLTRLNQAISPIRQPAAQRWEQDLMLGVKKRQIASAFIGEMDVILNELHHELLRPAIENALHVMEASPGTVEVERVRLGKYTGSFDKCPANVRLFPSTIAKKLIRFYAIVEETKLNLDWYSRVIETYANQQVQIVQHRQLIRLLKEIRNKIDLSSKLGRRLVEDLKIIRDTESKSPSSDEWWGGQTVDFRFQGKSSATRLMDDRRCARECLAHKSAKENMV